MKSFLEIIQEEQKSDKHHVMTFGRMNPPTTGHLKLIDKVKEVAKKHNAEHSVVVSHSQDAKKNPLSGEQKVKHLKRYSPGTNFHVSSKEHPTFLHHAEKLHKSGVTHLHMVVGSDRVKEMHEKLHKYNGTHKGALYHFKKITVHSAGHRDPDAEGSEGMSGTKMREHAKSSNHKEFRKGVPEHVSDKHAKELLHDTRKGMGLHENIDRGQFKAIFVTGGPGSGKDIIIREAIAESRITELNFVQAKDYLADKQKLSEQSKDFRREAIRNRGPLIINGPADDRERLAYIKEELEELGYETMMVFVNTTNETSKERNTLLSRMMVESIRQDKWLKSQQNTKYFTESFINFISFDNTGDIDSKEEDIHDVYESTKKFLDLKTVNETADDWLNRNFKTEYKEQTNVKSSNRFLQIKTNRSISAKGPADITPDNSRTYAGDEIRGNTYPRKNPNGKTYTFGQNAGVYAEEAPTIQVKGDPKESNFSKDKEKVKLKKFGDKSLSAGRVARPDGIGSEWNTRTNGSGLTGGAGLGNQTYSESEEYSNASPASTAMPSGGSPNPLSGEYAKDFKKFRKVKEAIDDPGANDMGVSGTAGGATNKEPLQSYKDADRNLVIKNSKKKNTIKEDHVERLESGLSNLKKTDYDSIDRLMKKIAKDENITGKELHNDFVKKHGKIPDSWIKEKKQEK